MRYALYRTPYTPHAMPYALCPYTLIHATRLQHTLHPTPHTLCPMPYALCAMPYALCPYTRHTRHPTPPVDECGGEEQSVGGAREPIAAALQRGRGPA
jgi:hypothetical protein